MGVFDLFRRRQYYPADPTPWITQGQLAGLEQYLKYGSDGLPVSVDLGKMSAADLWRSQPHLRTVVSFRARNIAQLGLHVFRRTDDDSRERDRDSVLARTLRRPNAVTTSYDLMYGTVSDLDLYDRAYWHVGKDPDASSGWTITRFPVDWVTELYRDAFSLKGIKVQAPSGMEPIEFPIEQVLVFHGYNPVDPRTGLTPVESLRDTLQEQMEAALYRLQVWKRGGRVSAVLTRPKDAPRWTDGARERFREDWNRAFTGRGSSAGGTPILGDGMDLKKIDLSAREQEFVAASKLSFGVVCSVYHVNPIMVGLLDNANYSNVREFRKAVYGDTLGPVLAQLEAAFNTFLLPMLGMDNDSYYAEFNVAEKLQGNFEEQADVLGTLVGSPIMTVNEGRSRINLSRVADGDTLLTPLNMGTPAPEEEQVPSAEELALAAGAEQLRHLKAVPQLPAVPKVRTVASKAMTPDGAAEAMAEVLRKFFARQERAVRGKLNLKAADEWWDEDRWDGELADDLGRVAAILAAQVGAATAAALGYDGGYTPEATVNFLAAVVQRNARLVNAATKAQIEDALEQDEVKEALDGVFNVAQGQRAGAAAAALSATVAGFAVVEATQQVRGQNEATKTWETGPNPRPSHASMNGETVGIDEAFSNGAQWPGDMSLDANESAGCNCTVSVNVEE